MSYTIYTMSCNFATHATCPLALIAYKYNELQNQLQNTFFSHSDFDIGVNFLPHLTSYHNITQFLNGDKVDLLYLDNNRQVITNSSS
jgi:hypothetical protein